MQVLCACDSVLAVRMLAVLVRMLAVRMLAVVVAVLVSLVVAVLVLAVSVLVIAMFVYTVSVLVIAMRVIVLVSQVRLLVPKGRHKHLTKSMTQQVAADKHAPGLFLRFVARNGPRTFYQVKLDPLIAARQRTFCSSKLSKHAKSQIKCVGLGSSA